jgi:hypothetical protein
VGSRICESGWMRKGIEVQLGPGDRERLEAAIGSGSSPQPAEAFVGRAEGRQEIRAQVGRDQSKGARNAATPRPRIPDDVLDQLLAGATPKRPSTPTG